MSYIEFDEFAIRFKQGIDGKISFPYDDTPHGRAQARLEEMFFQASVAKDKRATFAIAEEAPELGSKKAEAVLMAAVLIDNKDKPLIENKDNGKKREKKEKEILPNRQRRAENLALADGLIPGKGFFKNGNRVSPINKEKNNGKKRR